MLKPRSERARKLRIAWIITKEVLFMALGIVSCLLPTAWRIELLIFIGMRSILLEARLKLREVEKRESAAIPEYPNTKEIKTIGKRKGYETKANKKAGR